MTSVPGDGRRRRSSVVTTQWQISKRELSTHIQLVLTDRSEILAGQDYGVMSPLTWRLADLSTKYAFLKDGVGGSMPLHMIERDLAAVSFVMLEVKSVPREGVKIDISAAHATGTLPGPAGRWVIDRIKNSPVI